jgi:hypothetical protein
VILAAAVPDDILGMMVLALVTSLLAGPIPYPPLAIVTAEAIGFSLLTINFGSQIVARLHPAAAKFGTRNSAFALSIAACLGLSLASIYVGMARSSVLFWPYRESPARMGAEVGRNEPLAASVRCLGCYSLTGAQRYFLHSPPEVRQFLERWSETTHEASQRAVPIRGRFLLGSHLFRACQNISRYGERHADLPGNVHLLSHFPEH